MNDGGATTGTGMTGTGVDVTGVGTTGVGGTGVGLAGATIDREESAESGVAMPAGAAFLFLAFESTGAMTELSLTAFIIAVACTMFFVRSHKHEPLLFLIGIGAGIVVELGLRIFGYQQVWQSASLFGIPFWLPIAWGVGFVLITRLGMLVRGAKTRKD